MEAVVDQELAKVVQSVQADNTRLTEMELRMRAFEKVEQRIEIVNKLYFNFQEWINESRDLMHFSERHLPLLIHLQVAEGLRSTITSESQRRSVLDFDNRKLAELVEYQKESEGHANKIKVLSQRLKQVGQHLTRQNPD